MEDREIATYREKYGEVDEYRIHRTKVEFHEIVCFNGKMIDSRIEVSRQANYVKMTIDYMDEDKIKRIVVAIPEREFKIISQI